MIKNLLFDLGGVIMDIKKENCVEAFRKLGLKDPDSFFGDYGQQGPFKLIEEGLISVADFHDRIRRMVSPGLTDAEIDTAFCKFLVGIPVERLRRLQQLRQSYGIYLLSNTNKIMWDATIADEFRKDGACREAYFDGIVTSFEAKCLKPAPEIFEYAIKHLGINAHETLFFDDSEGNLRGARALGFHTAHVPAGREFIDILREMNLA